jgi:type VI protein secretion system component VasK
MKPEFSKRILITAALSAAIIVVASFVLMWHTGDVSPLTYIIPGIFTELSAATGFYFWKAKAENTIKLDMERKKLDLQQGGETDPDDGEDQETPDADPE